MNINDVIKYPILTEKTHLLQQQNVFTFVVDKKASKTEIKKAVEFIFDVKVEKVNVLNVRKKPKRVGKYYGFIKGYKKAIVTLKEGSIQILPDEGIAAEVEEKEVKSSKKDDEAKKALEKKVAEKIKKSKDKKEKK